MMAASLISLNVFCGVTGMVYGSKFVAALNFAAAAFVISLELIK